MPSDATILVALATYNEVDNLPSLVEAIHAELPDAHVLVVDDNSPDGTGNWCTEMAERTPWFSCLHRAGKLGLGSALLLAMQTAIERDYQFLITMDADWSHPPRYLPHLVAASREADVVIGSRYCEGGGIDGWSWRRRVVSRAVNLLTRVALGVPVRDCSGNFRLYATGRLGQLRWDELHADGYAYIEEVLWYLHLTGASFAEVPIVFIDRQAGVSKINLGEALAAMRTLARLGWKRIFSQKKPSA